MLGYEIVGQNLFTCDLLPSGGDAQTPADALAALPEFTMVKLHTVSAVLSSNGDASGESPGGHQKVAPPRQRARRERARDMGTIDVPRAIVQVRLLPRYVPEDEDTVDTAPESVGLILAAVPLTPGRTEVTIPVNFSIRAPRFSASVRVVNPPGTDDSYVPPMTLKSMTLLGTIVPAPDAPSSDAECSSPHCFKRGGKFPTDKYIVVRDDMALALSGRCSGLVGPAGMGLSEKHQRKVMANPNPYCTMHEELPRDLMRERMERRQAKRLKMGGSGGSDQDVSLYDNERLPPSKFLPGFAEAVSPAENSHGHCFFRQGAILKVDFEGGQQFVNRYYRLDNGAWIDSNHCHDYEKRHYIPVRHDKPVRVRRYPHRNADVVGVLEPNVDSVLVVGEVHGHDITSDVYLVIANNGGFVRKSGANGNFMMAVPTPNTFVWTEPQPKWFSRKAGCQARILEMTKSKSSSKGHHERPAELPMRQVIPGYAVVQHVGHLRRGIINITKSPSSNAISTETAAALESGMAHVVTDFEQRCVLRSHLEELEPLTTVRHTACNVVQRKSIVKPSGIAAVDEQKVYPEVARALMMACKSHTDSAVDISAVEDLLTDDEKEFAAANIAGGVDGDEP